MAVTNMTMLIATRLVLFCISKPRAKCDTAYGNNSETELQWNTEGSHMQSINRMKPIRIEKLIH